MAYEVSYTQRFKKKSFLLKHTKQRCSEYEHLFGYVIEPLKSKTNI